LEDAGFVNHGAAKKLKPNMDMICTDTSPIGLMWDRVNYSCAYDALFSILYYVWITNPHKWNRLFKSLNPRSAVLANTFQKVFSKTASIEQGRDQARTVLHALDPNTFSWGRTGTTLVELLCQTLRHINGVHVWYQCPGCHCKHCTISNEYLYTIECANNHDGHTIYDHLMHSLKERCTIDPCAKCGQQMNSTCNFVSPPKIIAISVDYNNRIKIDKQIHLKAENDRNTVLHLRGLIYFGEFHFVSRIITLDGKVWFHDGMTTGSSCIYEGTLRKLSNNQLWAKNKKTLTAVLYVQK